jgi:hypothetical protein
VVKNGSPLLYFAKKGVAGEVRGNNIAPGRLQASKLDPDFRQPIYPIEVAPGAIFQFDAEVLGGKIVVVATTGDGIVVASSPTAELHFTRKSYGAPPTLTSPVILPAVTGSITVCALDGEGTSSARVLVSNVAIP